MTCTVHTHLRGRFQDVKPGVPIPHLSKVRYRSPMPSIVLNGEPHDLEDGATVLDVLQAHGLKSAQVAMELNRQIVPRDKHAAQSLASNDRLEIVTFVGGG